MYLCTCYICTYVHTMIPDPLMTSEKLGAMADASLRAGIFAYVSYSTGFTLICALSIKYFSVPLWLCFTVNKTSTKTSICPIIFRRGYIY